MRHLKPTNATAHREIAAASDGSPVMHNGVLHLPATDIFVIGLGASDEECTGGLLLVSMGRLGLQVTMAPETLRGLAASMTEVATLAEAAAKRAADDLFRRAGGGIGK